MRFGTSGDLTLQLDCNRGNSTWEAARPMSGPTSLSIGEIASTRALCPSPSYGEEMAAVLPLASSYTVSRDGRVLEVMTRTGVFVFRTN